MTMLVVISPWLARNAIDHGHPSMSVQGSVTLFMRVFDVDGSPIPTDKPYGRFAREVQQRPDRGGLEHEVKVALVEERRLSEEEAFDVEKTLALTAIRREPGEYALGTWRELKRSVRDINGFDGSSALLDELDRTRPPVPESATTGIWEVARPLSSVWWLLSLNVVAGLLVLLTGEPARRRAGAALISVWVVVTLCTVLAAGEMWRFSIQLAPLTWLLGSAGAAILVSSVWSWLASRSRRPRAEGKQVSPT
jgi:hypothetical protein